MSYFDVPNDGLGDPTTSNELSPYSDLKIGQMTLAELQKYLEASWIPDARQLLGAQTVNEDVIGGFPYAKGSGNGTNVPTATQTTVPWTTVLSRNIIVAGTTLTVTRGGLYLAVANVEWQSDPNGDRIVEIYVNTSLESNDYRRPAPSGAAACSSSIIFPCSPGDTFSVQVFQSSAGALNLTIADLSVLFICQSIDRS